MFGMFCNLPHNFPTILGEIQFCVCHGSGTVPGLLPILGPFGLLPFLPASSVLGKADAPGQKRTRKMSHGGASDGVAAVQWADAWKSGAGSFDCPS